MRSPVSYFLILPMLFAGLAYSAGTVTFLAGFGVVTSLVVGLLTPDRSWSTTAFLAVAIVIAGVITAAAAAHRDRLMRQLMAAASVDALTGCLTRGAFQERLVHESMLAQRHGGTFSVIVADLDNLKALNDANGHHCGDRALRLLASVLRQAARETDVVGRLGGDEFALLLHETDQEAALAAATRLRDALHDVTGSDWVTASSGSARGWARTTGRTHCCAGPTRRCTWPSAPVATAPSLWEPAAGGAGGAAVAAAGGRATQSVPERDPGQGGRLIAPSLRRAGARCRRPPGSSRGCAPPPTGGRRGR